MYTHVLPADKEASTPNKAFFEYHPFIYRGIYLKSCGYSRAGWLFVKGQYHVRRSSPNQTDEDREGSKTPKVGLGLHLGYLGIMDMATTIWGLGFT